MTTTEQLGGGQSPIDVSDWVASEAPSPTFAYDSDATRVEWVQGVPMIHFAQGSELRLGEKRFRLLQLHWHTPAEHTMDAEEFAAEIHYVHLGESEDLLVVAVMYRPGDADGDLQRIIDQTPASAGDDRTAPSLSAADYEPAPNGFFHYVGSLTAAPFSEPVQWYVGRSTRTVSQRQVEQLQALTGGPNARPLQDRNGRRILCVCC